MAACVDRGCDHRDLQVHGFGIQHERVEIIGEALHHVGNHHRLGAASDGTLREIRVIRQYGNILAANLTHMPRELLGSIGTRDMAGSGIQRDRANRYRTVVQLPLLAQELQRMFNTLSGAYNHGGVGIFAFLTAEQHHTADDEPHDHCEQHRANHAQYGGKQRQVRVQNEIHRAHHNAGKHGTLEQQQIQLVAITHHMAVIHAHTMQAQHPDHRTGEHIPRQSDMETESRGIQGDLITHHEYNNGSENI